MAKKIVNVTKIDHDKWVEVRRDFIGGSDAATILGLNPFASKFSLWADKMGMSDDKEDNEAMRIGRDLEEYVAQRFCEATGKKVRRNNFMWQHDEHAFMSANLDREIIGENAGLECKTTSLYNKTDFANGEISLSYYCQCMHYMAVMGFDKMYLAVLVLGKGFYHFEIENKQDEIQNLIQAEHDFWTKHIVANQAPEADETKATAEVISKLFPASASTDEQVMMYEYNDQLAQYEILNRDIKLLEADRDLIKNTIAQKLGNAKYGVTGAYDISYKPQSRSGIDSKLLKEKYPDIAEEVATTSEFKVMRIKKLKEEN